MKAYKVEVVEKHADYVWVVAETEEEAEDKAVKLADCHFECTYSSEVVAEQAINTQE